jgi:hypothetical protein
MKEFKIAPSKNTPEVYLSPKGIIKLKGRSIHEDVANFFDPVAQWIEKYIDNPAPSTTVDLNLEYCNSSSAKAIINMLQQIMRITEKEKTFVINWYYEDGDDDIFERGEYFAAILGVPMNFIKI